MTLVRRLRPWWFCCGWRSYLCVADTVLHRLHLPVRRICDAHDRAVMGDPDDWGEPEPSSRVANVLTQHS